MCLFSFKMTFSSLNITFFSFKLTFFRFKLKLEKVIFKLEKVILKLKRAISRHSGTWKGALDGLWGLEGSLELWDAFWEIIGGVLKSPFSIF